MRQVFDLVTDLGDATLLAPASALLLIYLLCLKATRTATIWLTTVALCAALTIALKLVFLACAPYVPLLAIRSPSGHTSMSMTFYGCWALMVAGNKDQLTRIALLSVGLTLVICVAVTRVIIHAHTPSEVLAGFFIGAICVAWFRGRYFDERPLSVPWHPFFIAIVALALAMHGLHWDVEGIIKHFAHLLQTHVAVIA